MTPRNPAGGVLAALAFGAGVIVTVEFSAVGLLPHLAAGLDRSLAEAGWLVSVFALASSLLGPVVTLALQGRAAGPTLAALLASFGALNLIAAVSPGYWGVFAVRAAQGALLPAYISLAIATVVADASRSQGRALAGLNIGVAIGAVVALPAAVAFAGQLDWQATFVALGVLALAAAVAVILTVPPRPLSAGGSLSETGALLTRPVVIRHLALSAYVFVALFSGYSYLAAYLREVATLESNGVALGLAAFGLAGLAGNSLAGRWVDKGPLRTTAAIMAVLAVALVLVAASADRLVLLFLPLLVWGGAHTAAFVACQSRVLGAAPDQPAFASALNISACNLGIAAGAAVGGMGVDAFGVQASIWSAAALAAFGAALAMLWDRGRDGHRGAAQV